MPFSTITLLPTTPLHHQKGSEPEAENVIETLSKEPITHVLVSEVQNINSTVSSVPKTTLVTAMDYRFSLWRRQATYLCLSYSTFEILTIKFFISRLVLFATI